MAIRFLHLEFKDLGSAVCAMTSVFLVVAAFWALLKLGEFVLSKIMSVF
jgi:hypothetical protein